MVWDCFSTTGMGPLEQISVIMNRFMYKDIPENTMRPWADQYVGRAFVFQQDNDSKHTSKHVKEWFRRRLSIFRSCQIHFQTSIQSNTCKKSGKTNWRDRSHDRGPEVPAIGGCKEEKSHLRSSHPSTFMPRRCRALVDAKGFVTKY